MLERDERSGAAAERRRLSEGPERPRAAGMAPRATRIPRRQREAQRVDSFVQVSELRGPDDRRGDAGPGQHPRQRHLRRLTPRRAAMSATRSAIGEVGVGEIELCRELVAVGADVSPPPPFRRSPARKPRASGLYGITPTPSSRQSGNISRSSSRYTRL